MGGSVSTGPCLLNGCRTLTTKRHRHGVAVPGPLIVIDYDELNRDGGRNNNQQNVQADALIAHKPKNPML